MWLGTVPVPHFPLDFARRCIKVSIELPTAIRQSSFMSLGTVTTEDFDRVSYHKDEYKKLLFSLTVMHAVVNQRERYGSFGWSQPYQFSPNDLQISLAMLEDVCTATP